MRKAIGLLILLLGFSLTAYAQGGIQNDIVLRADGKPAIGSTVRVCTEAAAGTPCSPLASIFTDKALTIAKTNPFATDSVATYSYYATPGFYKEQICLGATCANRIIQIAMDGSRLVGPLLPEATGEDFGSAALSWDGFFNSLVTGSLNDIRWVDDKLSPPRFATPQDAETDCGTTQCLILIGQTEGTGMVLRSVWNETAPIIDLRGDELDPFQNGAYYSPFKFIQRKTESADAALDLHATIRALQFHDSGGDNVGGGPKDTYFTFAGDLYSAGSGQDIAIRGAAFKFGSGDNVAAALTAQSWGNCLEAGGECNAIISGRSLQGTSTPTGNITSYTAGTRTIVVSSGAELDKLGVDRVIINTKGVKVHTTGSVSSISGTTPATVTGSGTTWATTFGAGAHTDLCFSQNDDDSSGGLKFVVPIRSITSDTELVLDYDAQAADKQWTGDADGSSYRIYKCALVQSHSFESAGATTASIVHVVGGTTDWAATDTIELPLGWAWYGGGYTAVIQNFIPSSNLFGVNVTNTGSDQALHYMFVTGGKARYGLYFQNTWECLAKGTNCNLGNPTGIKFANLPTITLEQDTPSGSQTARMLRVIDNEGTTGSVDFYYNTGSDCYNIEHSASAANVIQFCPLNGTLISDILSVRAGGRIEIGADPSEAGAIRLPQSVAGSNLICWEGAAESCMGILTAIASLDFDFSAAGITCQDLTMTVTGATDADNVTLGLPNALASSAGVLWSAWVSAADTVTVRGCDVTSSNVDPAAATVRADVWIH